MHRSRLNTPSIDHITWRRRRANTLMAQSRIYHNTPSRNQIRSSESFFSQNYRCKFSESGLLSLLLIIIMSLCPMGQRAHRFAQSVPPMPWCALNNPIWRIPLWCGAHCAASPDRIKECDSAPACDSSLVAARSWETHPRPGGQSTRDCL
jgi:hypothetical protein